MRALCLLLAFACACSTRPPDAKCKTDLNCPTGFYCGAALLCETLPSNFAVTPKAVSANVFAGDTIKLEVTSVGAVVWSLLEGSAAGSIEQDGTYHAPVAAGTFHAVVTSTADPAKSASITLTVTFLPPVQPVITAPDPITTGLAGLQASAVAHAGMTYAWTLSGGTITSAASGVTASGKNTITFTAGAVGTLSFTCVETNAGSVASPQGTKNVQVIAGPQTPVIVAASPVFTGATGRTASVTARSGYTYKWTLSGGALLGADTGITSGGQNTVTWTAGAVGTATFTCVESNLAGTQSAPATAQVAISAASQLSSASPITAGTDSSASVPASSGHGYTWTISGGAFTGAGAAGTTSGSTNTVTFTAGSAGTLHLACVESGSGTSFSADVQVVAAPQITSFTASPAVITTGQSSVLTGFFSAGTGAVDQGIGAVQSGVGVSTGAITAASTDYTLTVTNSAGAKVTSTVTVAITNGSFSTTGSLGVARAGASATRLGDGTVLVAGGLSGTTPLASAELFSGSSFAGTSGPLGAARSGHTATLLPDGRVLIAGGSGASGPLSSAELYDRASKTFSPSSSPLTAARRGHVAVLLMNGKVLLAGGFDAGSNALLSAELFDPATNSFTATGDLKAARGDAAAVRLWTGDVLLTGGRAAQYLLSAELYDTKLGTFSLTGSLAAARARHALSTLSDGRVLVTGGENDPASSGILQSAERYDPVAKTFAVTGVLRKQRRGHVAVTLGTGKVLIAGGEGSTGTGEQNTLESYDDAGAGLFSLLPGTVSPTRQQTSVVQLGDGRLLIAGGKDPSGALASAVLYDPSEITPGTWSKNATGLTSPRGEPVVALLGDGRVLIAGGYDAASVAQTTADLFNPRTGSVSATANQGSSPRWNGLACTLGDGRVLLSGGQGSNGLQLDTADLFDPRTNLFTATGKLTTPRKNHECALLPDGRLLVFGGYSNASGSTALNTGELYDPAAGAFTAVPGQVGDAGEFFWGGHSLTLLPTGKVLLAGSSNGNGPLSGAWLYDPATNGYTATGSMPAAKNSAARVLLSSGLVLLAGGIDPSGTVASSTALLFSPWTGSFTSTGSLSSARAFTSGVLLPSGKALVAGGAAASGGSPNAAADLYTAGAFAAAGSLPAGRRTPLVLLRDGRAALFGGLNTAGTSAEMSAILLYK